MAFAMQLTGKVKTRVMISCSECGREFQKNRKADLQRHMRIHTNEKPFVCPYPECGRAFRQSSALKNHSNYHQRDDSFTCQHCKMNFFDKPTFNRHMREKHELEYLYACSVLGCGKTFKRKPVFKQHMQDKHALLLDDHQLVGHRVPAGPYLKAANGSKAVFHSSPSPLPKLSEALQSIRSPQSTAGGSIYYPSNPAVYGMDNASPVLLSDPYANVTGKAAPPTYAASVSHYAQPPSEYAASYSPVMPSDLWLTGGPNDTTYFDKQILGAQYAGCVPTGARTISFSLPSNESPHHTSPNPSFVFSSESSSGISGNGVYSPQSRSSSISPVSSQNSPETHSHQPQYGRPFFY